MQNTIVRQSLMFTESICIAKFVQHKPKTSFHNIICKFDATTKHASSSPSKIQGLSERMLKIKCEQLDLYSTKIYFLGHF